MALSLCLTCLPLVYLLNVFIDSILIRNGVPSAQSILIPYFVEIHGGFDPLMFVRSFASIPLGLVLGFMTCSLIKGLASFSGILANAMLGPGATTDHTQPHTLNYISPTRSTEQRAYYAASTHMAEQQSYSENQG